eukprot:TRINITY_DN9388_c0_g1_i1.p1 TRINITY_DN9388_c0_g1~~TRINITY_DN9388_c0_g1_i1.p1  ORF type:complete len:270 (+),score=70.80 TRINITY_DN9388_c0_g1_i1:379-1188(+)
MVGYSEKLLLFGGIHDITHEKDDFLAFDPSVGSWKVIEDQTRLMKEDLGTSGLQELGTSKIDEKSPLKRRVTKVKGLDSPALLAGNIGTPRQPVTAAATKDEGFGTNNTYLTDTRGAREDHANRAEERKRKLMLMKKHMMLSEFNVTSDKEKEELEAMTPTSLAMKNSLLLLFGKAPGKERAKESSSLSPLSVRRGASRGNISFGLDPAEAQPRQAQPFFHGRVVGVKPCPRDGHSAVVLGNELVVFGGDRHKMSFNDLYICDLKEIKN